MTHSRYQVESNDPKCKRVAAVRDTLGGWVCSTHTTYAAAQKRADELNAKRAAEAAT